MVAQKAHHQLILVKASHGTDPWRGHSNNEEREEVAEHDTTKKNYTEFSA